MIPPWPIYMHMGHDQVIVQAALAGTDNSEPERVLKNTWYTHSAQSGQLEGNQALDHNAYTIVINLHASHLVIFSI